ncbi:CMGC/SRPK protein kinase [Coprinopsis cinerea AmutBmut pab1-1]|nr:CMGC/SRPK protein kinase [Coprinopsis cinerea AmutBmut pab1-1]
MIHSSRADIESFASLVGVTFQPSGSSRIPSEHHPTLDIAFSSLIIFSIRSGVHSALKVVKSAGRYAETARDEIKLLSRVASVSPDHPGRAHIVSFLDSFSHQGPESSHICIVFEPLGENLLALIERNKKKGVPKALVKIIAKQVLLGLQYLHDECDLVHTDIKPENILISIPDIEAHIHQELSLSPSPASRRVGVPLPTKSRAGVTIPYNNRQGSKRQVQIFESQPLSSPGRSLGRNSAGGHSNLTMSRAPGSGSASGHNSQSNSYVAQMNILRNSSHGLPAHTSFISGAPTGSSAPKVPSHLSCSFAVPRPKSPMRASTTAANAAPVPPPDSKSPSTSSSSSSISSALVSTLAGSGSLISTPPTSLSQSMTSGVVGFTKSTCLEVTSVRQTLEELDELTRSGIPIQMKGKEKEPEGLSAGSSPLKPSSWIEQASSLSSSYKSKGSPFKSSKPRSSNRHGHSHSQSGAPWQDPGVASPAPAVLVNAVASADGQETSQTAFNSLRTSSSSTSTITIAHSESSSTTATATQPSPTGTPLGPRKTKTMSIINGVSKLISDTSTMLSTGLHPTSETKPNTNTTNRTPQSGETNVTTNHVSLLTQTAPTRISANVEPLRTTTTRPSPPQHISQLSAHMHSEPCPSLPSHDSVLSSHFPSETSRPNFTTVSTAIAQRLVFGTSSSPAPPPPTPVDGPVFGSFPISPPPPFTSQFPNPPPISIKIADLGNATPSKKHFTEDIQTRQYRAPEAIVGRKDWDTRADVWSVACVVFELLTAEYLFDPQGQGELFTKDDDHMAQIIELLGDFPLDVKMGGKYSRELFDHTGALRYIRTLKPWPLKRVMIEKYLYSEEDSDALCAFLEPMLKADMRERAHARDMLDHPWLDVSNEEEVTEW